MKLPWNEEQNCARQYQQPAERGEHGRKLHLRRIQDERYADDNSYRNFNEV
ncbi:MAG: hypothetical protein IPG22_20015 [Acidobacteria bacterium]|nr:hypothetical protein [Acidobacteriota bacterium]